MCKCLHFTGECDLGGLLAECGTPCVGNFQGMGGGICDGNGRCVEPLMNPCSVHGCEGKACGEECLMGDIMGWCDARGDCGFSPDVECSKIFIINIFY